MAAMTTVLKEFTDNGNSRTYSQATHTAVKPHLVLQKRKVPSGNQTVLEDTITVLAATEDSDGAVLPSRILYTASVRRPVDGTAADVTSMLAVFRDIVASDEFANMIDKQEWVVQ